MSKSKSNPKILKFKPKAAKITRMEFSAMHYMKAQFDSDMFYTSLANKMFDIIANATKSNADLTPEICKRAALTLAGYLEDLVSDSKIWTAFTSLHEKKYGRKLPFYNLDRHIVPYDDDMPSMRAVQFLLWYVFNDVKPDTVMNPLNPGIEMLSMQLMPVLMDAYEDAPDSPSRPMIISEKELGVPVFYQIRNICQWLCTGCYLTRVTDMDSMIEDFSMFVLRTNKQMGGNDSLMKYTIDSFVPLNALIGPIGLPACEWYAEIVSLNPEKGEKKYLKILREMKSLPFEFYKYKSVNGDKAVVINQSGEEMHMSATTMPEERFTDNIKAGVASMMSLVYFDGAWVMNSLCLQPLEAEVYDNAHTEYVKKLKDNEEGYKFLLKKLGKKRIGVCANYDEYMSKVTDDDSWREKITPDMYRELNDVENLLYFVNTDSTVSMLPDWGGSVKFRGNKYYNKEEAKFEAISLIFDHSLGTAEFREYLIENNLIPDAEMTSLISEEAGRKLFQENIRFFNDYMGRNKLIFLR